MATSVLQHVRRRLRHEWRRTWSTWATRDESAAVLRLIAASAAAGVPAATILDAWAEDGRGGQGTRLEKAARLLRQGATASEAAAGAPGLVQDDHAAALAFGEKIGLVEPVVQATLASDDLLDPTIRRSFRAALGYLATMLLLFLSVSGFMVWRVGPQLRKIFEDHGRPTMPSAMNGLFDIFFWLSIYWYVPFVLLLGLAIARFFPAAWRLVTRPFSRSRQVAAALDALAVADACGRPLRVAETALADCQVDPVLATRLRKAAASDDAGRGLAIARLVTPDEAAEIDAAGEARPSVLERLAASRRTRSRRWATALAESLVPLVVLLMGALVLLQALAVFESLATLINDLS